MSEAEKKAHGTISDWLGDIVALESHVEEALDRQLELKPESAGIVSTFRRFHDTVRASKARAEEYQKQYGSTAGNPVIKAGSSLLGKAAGVIDKMRHDSASKALRDDFTAFNHVAIAYTMLYTTAKALEDRATQDFAEHGLKTYASLVQDVNQVIPEAVVLDLRGNEDVPPINDDVAQECRSTIDNAWKVTKN